MDVSLWSMEYLVWKSPDKIVSGVLKDGNGVEKTVAYIAGSSYISIVVRHRCLQSRLRDPRNILAAPHWQAGTNSMAILYQRIL